jgi:hypothetical protein
MWFCISTPKAQVVIPLRAKPDAGIQVSKAVRAKRAQN